jgi:hypothetical protein
MLGTCVAPGQLNDFAPLVLQQFGQLSALRKRRG